jgi:uncharacterized Zn-binding protein involved in type VI secretion
MGLPAAKQGDTIIGLDTHEVLLPTPPGGSTWLPHVFFGVIDDALSDNVRINGKPAAVAGSTATNTPHIPTPPGIAFVNTPKNRATIVGGSGRVRINSKAAARGSDDATTCNDPSDERKGTVVAVSNVSIG